MPTEGRDRRLFRMAVIAVSLLGIGVLHHVTPHSSLLWHNVFQWLYYLPVVYAATHFGLRGGLVTAALAGAGYVPHFLEASRDAPEFLPVQYAEVAVLVLVSTVTGILADREHRRREELQKTSDQLDQANRELQASFEQLRKADRLSAVGELAASLAHEIRNPLASIRGAVDVLNRSETSEDTRGEFRGIIQKECVRLENLLTNLLDLAKPRPPQYACLDIGERVDSIITLVTHAAGMNRVRLSKDVPSDMPPLECDPEQVRQVLLNLTLNAVQAMSNGGEILLKARPEGENMLLEVRDQGVGVQGEIDRIFEPFYTTKEQGTGLGLAVVRQIVAQHGGAVSAQRNSDGGMTFSVLLPLRRRT